MQHTMEPGPLLRQERCCITVVYRTNRLANVCCINDATQYWRGKRCCITAYGTKGLASICCIGDATHHGTRPTFEAQEMLHHKWSAEKRVSEYLLHRWCNTEWNGAHFPGWRDDASPLYCGMVTGRWVTVATLLQQTTCKRRGLQFKSMLQDVFDLNWSKCCIRTTASPVTSSASSVFDVCSEWPTFLG